MSFLSWTSSNLCLLIFSQGATRKLATQRKTIEGVESVGVAAKRVKLPAYLIKKEGIIALLLKHDQQQQRLAFPFQLQQRFSGNSWMLRSLMALLPSLTIDFVTLKMKWKKLVLSESVDAFASIMGPGTFCIQTHLFCIQTHLF
uniref:Uncharacterized protein n=1 Tax=Nicotiana tabacum TaxID=4097 RepID=A0A1S3ZPT7_TOBAC|nr:PREDICTED: uncharacterized protein LOC107789116 [Nicotiana tabacum]